MSVRVVEKLGSYLGLKRRGQDEVAGDKRWGLTEGRRGIGYCLNVDCSGYARSIYIFIPRSNELHCRVCGKALHLRIDQWWREGIDEVFRKVIIEYDYSPLDFKFHEMAIVEDNEVKDGAREIVIDYGMEKDEWSQEVKRLESLWENSPRSKALTFSR